MPDFELTLLISYSVAALAVALSPGPDMMFCFTSGVAGGRKAGAVAGAGIGFALLIHLLVATFGLASLVAASPIAFAFLRWLGAAYLLWLAWQMLRSRPLVLLADRTGERTPMSTVFRHAVVTCLLNPKLLMFLLAFLPQFVRPEAGNVALQTFILGVILAVPGLITNVAVGVGGGQLAHLLQRYPNWSVLQNRFVAFVFFCLAARLLIGNGG